MVSESVAQGASLPRGVRPASTRFLESVVSLITWRPRCSEEAAVPVSGQSAVKEALFRREGRLLYATTDWRILCRPICFDTGSAAAVGRQERWTQRFFVWLAEGGEDGGEL